MTDEEFEKRLQEVVELLKCFQRIKDKASRKRFRSIIRAEIVELTKVN